MPQAPDSICLLNRKSWLGLIWRRVARRVARQVVDPTQDVELVVAVASHCLRFCSVLGRLVANYNTKC